MKALRGTPEANPRVAPTPPLEVPFELPWHPRVYVREVRVEQRFDRVDCASEVDVRGVGSFSAQKSSLSLRIGEKLRYVAQRDLESIAAQTTSLVHRLVLVVAGEQRRRRFDTQPERTSISESRGRRAATI